MVRCKYLAKMERRDVGVRQCSFERNFEYVRNKSAMSGINFSRDICKELGVRVKYSVKSLENLSIGMIPMKRLVDGL
jgi:hypothetical protein